MGKTDISTVFISKDIDFKVIVPLFACGDTEIPSKFILFLVLEANDKTLSGSEVSDGF